MTTGALVGDIQTCALAAMESLPLVINPDLDACFICHLVPTSLISVPEDDSDCVAAGPLLLR